MKCPSCGYDQKAKYGLHCGRCQYHFSFNPKTTQPYGITDGKFMACIRSASQNDATYFTVNQLYAAACRRLSGGFMSKMMGGMLGWMGIKTNIGKLPRSQFDNLLRTWRTDGKPIERLIEEPTLHEPPPEWGEPDLYDYGVERLLIVERDILVDLFVLNGLHAEQRMLVVAESGYPEYLLPVAKRLLEAQPELPVFILHDATSQGTAMIERIRSNRLLPLEGHPLIDMGMFPGDFEQLKRTSHYDPDNEARALPVDAMMVPFMVTGIGLALVEGAALGDMIQRQQEGKLSGEFSDFG